MMEVEDRIVAKVGEAISAGFDRLTKSRDNQTLYSSEEKFFSTRISSTTSVIPNDWPSSQSTGDIHQNMKPLASVSSSENCVKKTTNNLDIMTLDAYPVFRTEAQLQPSNGRSDVCHKGNLGSFTFTADEVCSIVSSPVYDAKSAVMKTPSTSSHSVSDSELETPTSHQEFGSDMNKLVVQPQSCKGTKDSLVQLRPYEKTISSRPIWDYKSNNPSPRENITPHQKIRQKWLCYVCGNSQCNGSCNWRRMSPSSGASKLYTSCQTAINTNWRISSQSNFNWRRRSSSAGSWFGQFNRPNFSGNNASSRPRLSWQLQDSNSLPHQHSSWRSREDRWYSVQGRPIFGRG